ncbi:MAG: hypothetical protein GWQ08_20765 [Verrucomicrobiaceae bacterium]|nr:hypothetical protein [Verrucomicrobiaceae bacterium]
MRTLLACRADLPEDLIYQLTQAIVEKWSELVRLHPAAA